MITFALALVHEYGSGTLRRMDTKGKISPLEPPDPFLNLPLALLQEYAPDTLLAIDSNEQISPLEMPDGFTQSVEPLKLP